MKTSEERDIEMVRALEAGRDWQRENNKQQNKVALLLIPTIVVIFILPQYFQSPFDGMVMGFGSAFLGALVVSVVSFLMNLFIGNEEEDKERH